MAPTGRPVDWRVSGNRVPPLFDQPSPLGAAALAQKFADAFRDRCPDMLFFAGLKELWSEVGKPRRESGPSALDTLGASSLFWRTALKFLPNRSLDRPLPEVPSLTNAPARICGTSQLTLCWHVSARLG